MLHHAKIVGAATVIASGAAAVVNQWVTVGAGVATIVGAAAALYSLRRRRRRSALPPRHPAPGASKRDWEIYGARIDQYFEDQRGSDG